ncbi:MAG: type II secretion system F family protein [Parcubacteria group bacterium]|nr:type II secretion system F family protein [Parcubacteria group bacterium]
MAEFIYQAKNKVGQVAEGAVEAHDENEAVSVLHNQGLVILALEPKERGLLKKDVGVVLLKPSNKDIVFFSRQLAILIDADVPLVSALGTLAEQAANPAFKKILQDVTEMVDAGSSFSLALAKYPKIFSDFFISLIKSGETAGKLHEVSNYLADYLEKQAEIRSKTIGALIYPAFLLLAVIGVFIVLFFGFPLLDLPPVIPQILSIVQEAGVEDLPLTTRSLILVNTLLLNYWYLILGLLAILAFWLFNYLKTAEGLEKYDQLKLKLPFLKKAIQGIYLARMSETLATLVKAGVPILDSLEITSTVVSNKVYQKILLESKTEVSRGAKISEIFIKYPAVIPPIITQMITVGEKTGKLDLILEHISRFYSNEADAIIRNLPSIIEPVVILIFGGIVFIIVSGVLLPLFSIIR